MKINETGAVHCADDVFEPGTWTLCGRRRAEVATRSPAEFDAYGRDFQCDVCGAQRRLIVAHDHPRPPTT